MRYKLIIKTLTNDTLYIFNLREVFDLEFFVFDFKIKV